MKYSVVWGKGMTHMVWRLQVAVCSLSGDVAHCMAFMCTFAGTRSSVGEKGWISLVPEWLGIPTYRTRNS